MRTEIQAGTNTALLLKAPRLLSTWRTRSDISQPSCPTPSPKGRISTSGGNKLSSTKALWERANMRESRDCSRQASLRDTYTAIDITSTDMCCVSPSHPLRLPRKGKPATSEEGGCNRSDQPRTPTSQTAASINHKTRLITPRCVPKCLVLQLLLQPLDFHTRSITCSIKTEQDTTRRLGNKDRQAQRLWHMPCRIVDKAFFGVFATKAVVAGDLFKQPSMPRIFVLPIEYYRGLIGSSDVTARCPTNSQPLSVVR
ncbi:hypothetical protein B0T13DRAFT_157219 [Neurospora crassa]|nr:hypothetical protein B0T13DRAFT_157219 [Neurospora crassa]